MIPKELNKCQIILATVARCIDILLLMSEVKQCRARSVLGWETAWEHWVLLASYTSGQASVREFFSTILTLVSV